MFGAAARDAIDQAWPTRGTGFPAATLTINLSGAFALGLLLELLVRAGTDTGWRRRTRLLVGTGFMGAYTTYSTFAIESDQLVRRGHSGTAALYIAVSVAGGLVAAFAGIVVGLIGSRLAPGAGLPVDPDLQ